MNFEKNFSFWGRSIHVMKLTLLYPEVSKTGICKPTRSYQVQQLEREESYYYEKVIDKMKPCMVRELMNAKFRAGENKFGPLGDSVYTD